MKTSETKMKSRINKVSKTFLLGFLIVVSTLSYSLKAQTNSYPFDTPNCCGVWTSTCSDPYKFYLYQCTSYVAWKLNQANDETPQIGPFVFENSMTGDASANSICTFQAGERLSHACRWADGLQSLGYFVDPTPVPGAIAHWAVDEISGGYGHVAYVESVNSDGIPILSEYNFNPLCDYNTRTYQAPRYIRFNRFAITSTPTNIAPNPLVQGQGCTITVEIKNEFSSDVTANFRCALYSSSNVFLGEIDTKNSEFFNADEIRTLVFSKPIINSSPGNYKIWIESRVSDDTPWTVLHKENASSIIPVTISTSGSGQNAPDIAITNINILPNYNPNVGDDVYFQATIENIGQVSANNINLNFIIDGQTFYSGNTNSLVPGATSIITAPAYIFNESGMHQCFAEAEAVAGETNLLNNNAVQTVVVYGEPFAWTTMTNNNVYDYYGVYYLNPTNAIAVGNGGKIATYNGTNWTVITDPSGAYTLNDVYTADANHIYAVGDGGHIIFYNGTQWTQISNFTYENIEAIHGTGPNNIYLVGEQGIIYHFDGNTWSLIESGTTQILRGIYCTGNQAFAVGNSGIIIEINGGVVTHMTSNTPELLYGIHGISNNLIYAVGRDATIMKYNGSTWGPEANPLPTNAKIYSVWVANNGEAFACTQVDEMLHYNGSNWEVQTNNIPVNLFDVFGISPTDVITVGGQGNIRHYESAASPLIINLPVPFKSQVPPGNWTTVTGCGKTNNCGQTSMVMSNSFFQYTQPSIQNIKDVDDYLLTTYNDPINCYNGSVTNTTKLYNIATNLYGYQNVETHNDWTIEDIKNSLLANKPVIVAVKTSMSTSGENHFMVLRGYDEENQVLFFNDPGRSLGSGYGKNVEYSVSQFQQVWATQGNASIIINEASGSGPGGTTSAPIGLTYEIASDTIIIGWEPGYGSNPSKYYVYRSDILIDSTVASQTVYVDTNRLSNVQYKYNITAFDTVESDFSQDINVMIPGEYFIPVWDGDNPYSPQNIIITSALFDGEPLTSGCEIAVFDGEICVGKSVLTDVITASDPLFIVAGADDATTTNETEGFTEPHNILFRYYIPISQSEIQSITASFNPTLDTVFTKLGTSVVELDGVSAIEQNIPLVNNWNIISFYVIPEHIRMDSIFKPLIQNGNLVKIINEAGGFMQEIPGMGWINTIGDMSNTEGYYIKLSSDDTLHVSGGIAELPYSIPLQESWNIMGFPTSISQEAISVLQPLINSSHLTKVISQSGGFIQNIPGLGWLNTINTFEPGEGYYIKLSADDTLHINNITTTAPVQSNVINEGKVYHRISTGYPYQPMHIVATFDNSITLVPGDELGVFAHDVCIGSGYISDASAPVVTFLTTNDPTTELIDGGQTRDVLQFKLLHLGREYDLQPAETVSYEPLETKVLTFTATGLDISENNGTGFVVSEVIPNPFSSEARIYVNIPETGNLKIELLDLRGVVIKSLFEREVHAQKLEVIFERGDLNQGMNFIHVQYQNDGELEDVLRKVVVN